MVLNLYLYIKYRMFSPIVEYILSIERNTISACSLHPLLIKFYIYFMQRFSSTTSMGYEFII